ncbi:pyridoxal-phosphate-dependent aminotransferase family protein [Chloroflexota bacterium]
MKQLRIPGPTPCPPEVLKAQSRQMINHRGVEFGALISNITENLQTIFQTKNDVLLLTGSGTGGLETAVVNVLSPGEQVLSVSIGVFGDRFADIARTFGAEVVPLRFEWGQAADPEAVAQALAANPKVTTVLVTHNETSTGVTNDLEAIAEMVKGAGKLLVVDAVSSLGSIDLPTDKWGCDVTVTGSQKGWMVPPGMAMVTVSPEAWKANESAKMPRFYWDLAKAKKFYEKKQTPWTPAVSTLYAFEPALEMMLAEGLPNIFARHARLSKMVRDGVKALGLLLFADEKHASNTVTSVAGAKGLDTKELVKIMREEHEIVLAGGQSTLAGKIFRIGHLGLVSEPELKEVLAALKLALPKAGFQA